MSDPSFPQSGLLGTEGPVPQAGQGATLAEALTVDRRAGVWWDYARDVSSIVNRVLGRVMLGLFPDGSIKCARRQGYDDFGPY